MNRRDQNEIIAEMKHEMENLRALNSELNMVNAECSGKEQEVKDMWAEERRIHEEAAALHMNTVLPIQRQVNDLRSEIQNVQATLLNLTIEHVAGI